MYIAIFEKKNLSSINKSKNHNQVVPLNSLRIAFLAFIFLILNKFKFNLTKFIIDKTKHSYKF